MSFFSLLSANLPFGINSLARVLFRPAGDCQILIPPSEFIQTVLRKHYPEFAITEFGSRRKPWRNCIIEWLSAQIPEEAVDKSAGITVIVTETDPRLLRAYRRAHPNRTVIVRLLDTVTEKSEALLKADIALVPDVVDCVETYCRSDAVAYGIRYVPNSVNAASVTQYKTEQKKYLWSFVGSVGSDSQTRRHRNLQKVRELFRRWMPDRADDAYVLTPSRAGEGIAYEEVQKILGQSVCAVDLVRLKPEEGYSFRIPEAMVMQTKVITDRTGLLEEDFYHPSRFYILGHDSEDRFPAFLADAFRPLSEAEFATVDALQWRKHWLKEQNT